MARWRVNAAYRSYRDGKWYGYWPEGQVVDLTDEEAQWVNRDAPGTLSEDRPAGEPKAGESNPAGDEEPEPPAEPARQRKTTNRQHRGNQDRSA